MHRMLVIVPLTALLCGCVVTPADRVVVAPALPVYVELDVREPYYYQHGYYYYYDNSHWHYSNSRSGPWTNLPRSHYPKETRFKGHRDRYHDHDHDRDRRDYDHDRYDQR